MFAEAFLLHELNLAHYFLRLFELGPIVISEILLFKGLEVRAKRAVVVVLGLEPLVSRYLTFRVVELFQ